MGKNDMRANAISTFCEFCGEHLYGLLHKNTFDHKNRIPMINMQMGDPRTNYFRQTVGAGTPVGKAGNLTYASVMDRWHSMEFLRKI